MEAELPVSGALAYFLTWNTYGTWLPGDSRGWHRKRSPGRRPPSEWLARAASRRMSEPSLELAFGQRVIVERTIAAHCEIRRWELHAVNARVNHIHAVVSAPRTDGNRVREQLKAWCTRKLRGAGFHRDNFWAEGGSVHVLESETALMQAVEYVLYAQDRKKDEADGCEKRHRKM
jgi:REP element-mobilizing transposase RayT